MKYRTLGQGLKVSAIGVGGSPRMFGLRVLYGFELASSDCVSDFVPGTCRP